MSPGVYTGSRYDIGDPIKDICEILGLEPANVKELRCEPRSVIATVYLLDEDGAKYTDDDGMVATELQFFHVTT